MKPQFAMHQDFEAKKSKEELWKSAFEGDYDKFVKLIDSGIIQDVNAYHEGITLLHAVVQGDTLVVADKVEYQNRANIAEILLQRGADLHLPAKETSKGTPPWAISIGQSPWQMTEKYRNMPFYFHEGIRASYCYTGEHVLPVFEKHLKINKKCKCVIL